MNLQIFFLIKSIKFPKKETLYFMNILQKNLVQ